jgi:molybdopterin synthase catalytic subunit
MKSVLRERLDPVALRLALEDVRSGGICIFEGRVRDHHGGKGVLALSYDCYEPMAEKLLAELREEAQRRWPLRRVIAVHRIGPVPLGELAVWIGVAAEHREEAFAACRFLIEEIKHRLPVWKYETYTDGSSAWSAGCAVLLPTKD